jgi:hypothetical protein
MSERVSAIAYALQETSWILEEEKAYRSVILKLFLIAPATGQLRLT